MKDKTTLIRIPISFTSLESNDSITPNVTLYWNGSFIGENSSHLMNHNDSANFDFLYVPSTSGTNIEIKAEVNGISSNGQNYYDENSKK